MRHLPLTRPLLRSGVARLVVALVAPLTAFAEPDRDDPAAELASFKLPPGFEANLFASEKDGVVKPIQMRWDTRGRLWVIQSTTYPQLVPGETPNDKVLILEDTNGDGVCDKTTVFADGLMIPTGLEIAPTDLGAKRSRAPDSTDPGRRRSRGPQEPERAGARPSEIAGRAGALGSDGERAGALPSACYVGEGTKLLLLTDTDGDGKCDKREVVLRGFGTGDNHQNINSFRWSPGGELMFSQGLHAHSRVETPHGIVPLDEAGFWRYRPREHRLDSFYGGPAEPQNPWGFVWTDWGQMLMVAGNNGGIYWPLPEMIRGVRYGRREQIWQNARGRKCSGPDIIGTAHLPPEWQGVMLSGGYINNAVWALKIEDDGAGFRIADFRLPIADSHTPGSAASPPISNQQSSISNAPTPLVTSTHTSFRPVDVKLGPDGAIYICDWYNPIIGHYQASFRHPDRDKAHGRIWRITYKGRPLVKPPQIAGAKVEALFENLKSPERWVREQTRRELAGRDPEESWQVLWPLFAEVDEADPAYERLLFEMISIFQSTSQPLMGLVLNASRSKSADLRAYAASQWVNVRRFPDGMDPWTQVSNLAGDPSARVRLSAIVAAANLPSGQHWPSGLSALSIFTVATVPNQEGDKFLEIAARAAVTKLKPQIEKLTDQDTEYWRGDWRLRLAELQRPPGSPKPAAPAASVPVSSTIAATGKLLATPEFVAELVKEVRASGDAKRGAEVYRRAELACVSCHSIEDKGGKIGPPLDTIGSGQPLDFIIGATLEPQREIKESYEALQITAKDGRTALGYIAARDPQQTTLRDPASGAETKFAASEIAEQKQLGSFMPAGLLDTLPREDLRDLFRYLSELGKPK